MLYANLQLLISYLPFFDNIAVFYPMDLLHILWAHWSVVMGFIGGPLMVIYIAVIFFHLSSYLMLLVYLIMHV